MKHSITYSFLAASIAFGTAGQPIGAQEEKKAETEVQTILHEGMIGSAKWTIDSQGVLTIGAGEFENSSNSTEWPWKEYSKLITRVDGTAPFRVSGSLKNAFALIGLFLPDRLTEVDLSGWNTTGVTSMEGLFAQRTALQTADLSGWDTSSVSNMEGMFDECQSLRSLDLSGFNTSKVERMGRMFRNCTSLSSLDLSGFDTSSVHDSNITKSHYDIQPESMEGSTAFSQMFAGCRSLTSLDLSAWDTSGVSNMNLLFSDCASLTDLSLKGWDTSHVTTMQQMFSGCLSLKSLDLSGWNVEKVNDFYALLSSNIQLESLNISGWNLKSVPRTEYAVSGCRKLSSIQYSAGSTSLLYTLDAKAGWSFNDSGSYSIEDLPKLEENQTAAITRTVTETFIPMNSVTISGLESEYRWTGLPLNPNITLKYRDEKLTYNDVYTYVTENVNEGTATVHIIGLNNYDGVLTKTFKIVKAPEDQPDKPSPEIKSVSMHRLYNPNSGEHFYTAADNEKNHLVSVGWKYEGEGWKAPEKSDAPVYRLYNANAGDHHYTLNVKEKDALVNLGWNYEGIGWYSDENKAVPLYREYNPNAKAGSHNYTPNKNEHNFLTSNGWKDEGIAWYGLK